jgi:hypothetical protein
MDLVKLFLWDKWYALTRYILTTKVLHGYTNTNQCISLHIPCMCHCMELFNKRDEITPLGLNGHVKMFLW